LSAAVGWAFLLQADVPGVGWCSPDSWIMENAVDLVGLLTGNMLGPIHQSVDLERHRSSESVS
jgi:hypothetical protein